MEYPLGFGTGFVMSDQAGYRAPRGKRGAGKYHSARSRQAQEEYEAERRSFVVKLLPRRVWKQEYAGSIGQAIWEMALILCELVSAESGNQIGAIHPERFARWDVDGERLIADALANMRRRIPPRLFVGETLHGRDFLREGRFEEEDAVLELSRSEISEVRAHGLLLTNTFWSGGAVAAFYPGVLDRLARICGGSYYLVFPWEHDARIHPEYLADPRDLRRALYVRNRDLFPGEAFCNQIFFYDHRVGSVEEVSQSGWRSY